MKDRPVVSVSMLAYNHAEFISEAIESVLMQNVDFKYEIVIGEDCSTDNTRSIILDYKKKYPDIIKPIFRDKNIGGPKNSYDTMMNCKGEYIATLEGDNFWTDKNKLTKQVEFLRKNPNVVLVGSRHYIVNKDSQIISNSNSKIPMDQEIGKKEFLKYSTALMHPTTMLYRNIFYNSDKDFSIIATSNKTGTFMIKLAILVNEGSIYTMSSFMGAWRYIVEEEGQNYASLATRYPLDIAENYFLMLKNFNEYFGKDFDFTMLAAKYYIATVIKLIKNNKVNTIKDIKKVTSYLSTKEKLVSLFYFPVIIGKIGFNKIKNLILGKNRSKNKDE